MVLQITLKYHTVSVQLVYLMANTTITETILQYHMGSHVVHMIAELVTMTSLMMVIVVWTKTRSSFQFLLACKLIS